MNTIDSVGNTCYSWGLIYLGCSLGFMKLTNIFKYRSILVLVFTKLLVIPLIVYFISHHFLTNGTHIEKTAFYHVGPFLENATAHDIHFCRGFAKISTCAVGCRAKIPCLPTQKISSSRCCGRKTIADFLLIVPGLLSQKYFSKNSNKSVVNSV